MCGLTGYFTTDNFFNKEDLEAMTSTLTHRGPDATGYFTKNGAGLGSTRLSIIDLSDRANQPMHSADGRYVAVYNGEVYNFSEIGAGLMQESTRANFRTSSDTEIVLEAFAKHGADFVKLLNGMFVIAIYDTQQNELHIFRDRIGIKPLYYYWDGKHFAFASELKALRKLSKIPKSINKKVIRDFLHLGYIPTPHSIYEKIFKMNSGTGLRISSTGLRELKYWNIHDCISDDVVEDKDEAVVKLSDLLYSSIQYQLKSDVPFGIFLSGGIDSSLIAAKAASASNVKPNTFTIEFEDSVSQEAAQAKIIAAHLNTDHHEFIVSVKNAQELIEDVFDAHDEPFADSSSVPTMLLSKLTKKHVSVALSGEGGDELFLGYGSYRWAQRLDSVFLKTFRKPLASIFSKMPSRYKRVGRLLSYPANANLRSHIFSQEQYWFAEDEIDLLLLEDHKTPDTLIESMPIDFLELYRNSKTNWPDHSRKLTAMEEQALFDLQFYLQDDLLTKIDRCGMHYSVETRVPYLDHRIIEYSLNISGSLKFRNGKAKYILSEILYKYLPRELFNRPKEGFDIPLNKWLHREFRYLIDENLNEDVVKKYRIVKYEEVKKLITMFDNGVDYVYNRIWLLIVLHKWFRKFEES
ncbi:MAG: asparagine synthase (glutamine-hydrolyzing) [Bacteroidia bacterium]